MTMKQKIVKRLLGFSLALLCAICAFQVSGGVSEFEKVNTSVTNAKVETWVEQNFWDVFVGLGGRWQTRTKYTINPSSPNTTRTYENRKLLITTDNDTDKDQIGAYSYTETVGHTFNATVGAKKGHFELAVGYTLNRAETETYTANVNTPPGRAIDVWGSDVRVKSQYTTYTTQVQYWCGGWINLGSPSTTRPLIKEYSGYRIEWIYA